MRIESVQDDQRQVWVLTDRGHREGKQLLERKNIRVSALRKEKYDPVTGELLAGTYDDHAAAVIRRTAPVPGSGTGSASRPRSRTGSATGTSSGQIW
ncbi:hypothetical protein [Streptomyces cellulosae]|uniref:hypothetical protein n=1 Tax=Streptomyces cellulosae TaxID=1968 RepID=UPI000AD36522|nr:hypothetical protein [Streptomyces cellulosae]